MRIKDVLTNVYCWSFVAGVGWWKDEDEDDVCGRIGGKCGLSAAKAANLGACLFSNLTSI